MLPDLSTRIELHSGFAFALADDSVSEVEFLAFFTVKPGFSEFDFFH